MRSRITDKTAAVLLGVIALTLVVVFVPPSTVRVIMSALIGAFIMHIIDCWPRRKG